MIKPRRDEYIMYINGENKFELYVLFFGVFVHCFRMKLIHEIGVLVYLGYVEMIVCQLEGLD